MGVKERGISKFNELYLNSTIYQTSNDRIIGKIAIGETFLLVEETDINGGNRQIVVLNKGSGAVKTSVFVNETVINMYFIDIDQAIVFTSNQSGSRISELSIPNSSLRSIRTLPQDIINTIEVNNGEYVLATNIDIQQYDAINDNLIFYLSKSNSVMAYDELSNILFFSTGRRLQAVEFGRQSNLLTTFFVDTITHINFYYNRN